jgi:hypothetical protein
MLHIERGHRLYIEREHMIYIERAHMIERERAHIKYSEHIICASPLAVSHSSLAPRTSSNSRIRLSESRRTPTAPGYPKQTKSLPYHIYYAHSLYRGYLLYRGRLLIFTTHSHCIEDDFFLEGSHIYKRPYRKCFSGKQNQS